LRQADATFAVSLNGAGRFADDPGTAAVVMGDLDLIHTNY
jgi:hypothetical protein